MLNSNFEIDSVANPQKGDNSMINFSLSEGILIDEVSTLDQLTARFQSVRIGIPELLKNAKDQYERLRIEDKENRQIVVLLNTRKRMLAVLDFAGASAGNFADWETWSDPEAGKKHLSRSIEAGHGNGGKSFMVRGAKKHAFLESCYEGRRTRKGFVNNDPNRRYRSGFGLTQESGNGSTDSIEINDLEEADPARRLGEALSELDADVACLPRVAQEIFERRNAYTIVVLDQVKEWSDLKGRHLGALAQSVVEIIGSHGQTEKTISTCQVWVVADGKVIGEGPVKSVEIEPYPGFEEPRKFELPDVLVDPATSESVDVPQREGTPAYLKLCTSVKQLQMSRETKDKNVVRVWNSRNNIATWELGALHSVASASFIYGDLHCPALEGENLPGAERVELPETPLVRAIRGWTAEKVKGLTNELYHAMAERIEPRERNRARGTLNDIRNLMRDFLNPNVSGDQAEGPKPGREPDDPGPETVYGKRTDEIALERSCSELVMIYGTKIPLVFRCFEVTEEAERLPIKKRDVDVKLRCSPEGRFNLDENGMLTAASEGVGEIWLETADGKVKSDRKGVRVCEATDVFFAPPSEKLMQGETRRLYFTFETPKGKLNDALIEAEILENDMGRINRHGFFKAGLQEGEAIARVRFASETGDFRDFSIEIGPDRVPPRGEQGIDVPEILFCGDTVPGKEHLPDEERTLSGGERAPTIIEDPLFPNVVWINYNSKEAIRVRKTRGGSGGVGGIDTRTFMQFVALKCFDILKRLHVRQHIRQNMGEVGVTENTYCDLVGNAETECVDFIDAAWDFSERLARKESKNG